ncbi:MAG TPA: 50S ribosomal protein L11 methyltransferase [Bacteroidia bacterium]|nr:50S ribosomal protein L11 methyltransferase [Bacteroidia bacterium]
MNYLEVRFYNDPSLNEALIAWLGDSEFQMFQEQEDGVSAFIPEGEYREELVKALLLNIPGSENIRFEKTFIKEKNWNKEWESNFEPVTVRQKVYIRAPFHPPGPPGMLEIIIEPKMSFGTGHHATTALMIEQILDMEISGKSVLDMGCGSGVLAILVKKLGAKDTLAIDIDDWAIDNSIENCERNHVDGVDIKKGDSGSLKGRSFNVVLANINRNVLLNDMETYASVLAPGGELVISGFFSDDSSILTERAEHLGLIPVNEKTQEAWASIRFRK